MALEGTIKDFGLPDIFQLIGLQRKTGILTLTSAREKVTVTFDGGQVVLADSSGARLEERLGVVLVKQGLLSQARLDELLQTQKQTLQRLGHILASSGAVNPEEVKRAAQLQVAETVFRLFRWKEGQYHFAPTDSVDYDKKNLKPMSADFILMEGIRMVDEWPIIEKKIPSMDLVFGSVMDASLIETGGEGEAASNKVRLTDKEAKVFQKVNGSNTVQLIIDSAGLGEFETCHVLFDLLNRNIIASVGRGAATQALEGPAETASPVLGHILAGVAVVLSVAAIGLHLATPFAVLGRPSLLEEPSALLLERVSRARMEKLDRAIMAFRLVHGEVPTSLEGLVEVALVDAPLLRDPWGTPYEYVVTQGGYSIRAAQRAPGAAPGPEIKRVLSAPPP